MIQGLARRISGVSRAVEERRFFQTLLERFAHRTVRSLKNPRIEDFLEDETELTSSPEPILDNLLGADWRDFGYGGEFRELTREMKGRYGQHMTCYHDAWRIEEGTGFVLYVWIRHRKPKVIVETGVANGHSTVILLNAISRNNQGELHSTDVAKDAGALVKPDERSNWHYHQLPPTSYRRAFQELLSRLGPIDLFFHDSLHTYTWQLFEYQSVFTKILPGGLLASDDVDSSYAFMDFCRSTVQRPSVLFDHRKLAGFISKAK